MAETLTRSQGGRITHSTATDSAGAANTVDWGYAYDAVGRLTQAVLAAASSRPAVTLGYGYTGTGCGADSNAGKNGSRVSSSTQVGAGSVVASSYCTDAASRLTSVSGGMTITPATVAYDTHGNATQLGTQSWTYDAASRVTSTTANGITPSLSVYVRDPLGRVVRSGPAASPTRYAFTGTDDSPDLQVSATGAIVERYVALPGGVLYTKAYAGTLTSWSISNLHGDTIATIVGATVTAGFVYDPFGQPISASGVADPAATPTTRTGTTTDAWHGSAQRGYEHTVASTKCSWAPAPTCPPWASSPPPTPSKAATPPPTPTPKTRLIDPISLGSSISEECGTHLHRLFPRNGIRLRHQTPGTIQSISPRKPGITPLFGGSW